MKIDEIELGVEYGLSQSLHVSRGQGAGAAMIHVRAVEITTQTVPVGRYSRNTKNARCVEVEALEIPRTVNRWDAIPDVVAGAKLTVEAKRLFPWPEVVAAREREDGVEAATLRIEALLARLVEETGIALVEDERRRWGWIGYRDGVAQVSLRDLSEPVLTKLVGLALLGASVNVPPILADLTGQPGGADVEGPVELPEPELDDACSLWVHCALSAGHDGGCRDIAGEGPGPAEVEDGARP